MAERIVSPGVFTRERDLSFLPQAIGEIGAAIIGPTKKGPAFVPTQISSFSEFEEMFGGVDNRFYTPYTVEQYLKSAGVVTIVRILGLGGYQVDTVRLLAHSSGGTTHSLAVLAPSRGSSGAGDLSKSSVSGDWNSFSLTVSGSNVSAETYTLSFNTSSANFITEVLSSDPQSAKSGNSDSSVYVYRIFKDSTHIIGDSELHTGGSHNVYATASIANDSNGLDFKTGATSID